LEANLKNCILAALIVSASILLAAFMLIYFSPQNTCQRLFADQFAHQSPSFDGEKELFLFCQKQTAPR
jgi:hypothetical protein